MHIDHPGLSLLLTLLILAWQAAAASGEAKDLQDAARQGDTRTVLRLLSSAADEDSSDSLGNTALILAAPGGHRATVVALLEKGMQTNAVDRDGRSALILASANGHAGYR